jgi:hypothetical protein
LAVFCHEVTVLPNTVRDYEIEKFPFFGGWLVLEQLVSTLG